jgi:hypothetical protein
MNEPRWLFMMAPFSQASVFITFLIAGALGGCIVKRPVLCLRTGPVSQQDVAGLRAFARDFALRTDAEITDDSDRYKSRVMPAELSVNVTVDDSEFELYMSSAIPHETTSCFYAKDLGSHRLHHAIRKTLDQLQRIKQPVTIANSGRLSELPESLRAGINEIVGSDQEVE